MPEPHPTRSAAAPPHTHSAADPAATTGGIDVPADPGPLPLVPERYVLGEEIARGGMGAVYRATDAVLNREVAVKVLQDRYGPASAAARRFADEARIAGQLQHPGIPPVHDLGVLPDGRPFLAMKLIKGRTLEAILAGDARPNLLAVFEAVCQAVAYAHAHHVIHRDLKPSNVMVGNFGEVQVMDWGLAKVLSASVEPSGRRDPEPTETATEIRSLRDSDATGTQAGSLLGTPAYMPPEQAIGAVDQIDERSDVFGLGAVLCEVLTGQPPYAGGTAESIRQQAARVRLDDAFARLDTSGAEPELVALCKRCLSVEKADRPADAGEVATAVAALRHAADERARRAEVERSQAEVRVAEHRKRRRVWIGLAAALLVGAVASAVLAIRARNAEHLAQHRLGEEEKARAEAEAVRDFFVEDMIGWVAPERKLGRAVTVDQVLEGAERSVGTRFKDQPLTEAAVRLTLGKVYRDLGQYEKAQTHLKQAQALFTDHAGPSHRQTIETMAVLGRAYWQAGKIDEAARVLEEALDRGRTALGPDDDVTLWALNYLSTVRRDQGKLPEYEALARQLLAARLRAYGEDHPGTVLARNELAVAVFDRGDVAAAAGLFREAWQTQRRMRGPDHPDALMFEMNLGECLGYLGQDGDAIRILEANLERSLAVCGPGHPQSVGAATSLASCLAARREPSPDDLARALELGRHARETQTADQIPLAWIATGIAHYRRKEWNAALAALEKASGISEGYYKCRNDFFLAMTYQQLGNPEKARQAYERAVTWMREKQTRAPDLVRFRAEAAGVLGIKDDPR